LLQTRLIQFEVHGFQQNIVHCTILTLLTVVPIMTYAPYRILYLSAGQYASSSWEGNSWSSFNWNTSFHPTDSVAT